MNNLKIRKKLKAKLIISNFSNTKKTKTNKYGRRIRRRIKRIAYLKV